MTQCSPLKINRRFGETYCLCFHDRRLSRTINKIESRCQAETLVSCSVVLRSWRWKRHSSPKRPFFIIKVVGTSNHSISVWTSSSMMRAAEARDWHEDESYIFLRNVYLYLEVKQSFCGTWQYGVDRILSVSSESPAEFIEALHGQAARSVFQWSMLKFRTLEGGCYLATAQGSSLGLSYRFFMFFLICNLIQQSEFTFYKLMLWLLQCLDAANPRYLKSGQMASFFWVVCFLLLFWGAGLRGFRV
jgi:hypothetical protein